MPKPIYTLNLSTEEIKTLQLLLEDAVVDELSCQIDRDLLTKILLAQMEADPPKDTGQPSFSNVPVF